MMLFACLRMMGHGDDSPRDGNDNWMAIASLSSPAISSVLGDSYLLSLIIYLLNVTRDTEILSEIHTKDNIILLIDLSFAIAILVIKIRIIILH